MVLRLRGDRLNEMWLLEPGGQHRLNSEGGGSPNHLFPGGRVHTERVWVLSAGVQGWEKESDVPPSMAREGEPA